MKVITKHYHNRVNAYKGTLTEEDLLNLLSNDEIEFLLPNGYEKIHQQLEFGAEVTPVGFLIKKVSKLNSVSKEFYEKHVAEDKRKRRQNGITSATDKNPKTLEVGLSKYSDEFEIKKELKTKISYLINGKMVDVTEDHYHTALAFARVHNLYASIGSIKEIVKGIMMGNVKETDEIKQAKQCIISELTKTDPEYNSIQEYFEEIEEQAQ